jgi:hypothetical protein
MKELHFLDIHEGAGVDGHRRRDEDDENTPENKERH